VSYLLAAYAIVLGSVLAYAIWLARRRSELAGRLAEGERPRRSG
jgi:uncharacterized iron-regulated membrane protein